MRSLRLNIPFPIPHCPRIATARPAWHNHPVSIKLIEQQLTELRTRVANLEAQVKAKPREAWKQIVGTSKGQALDRQAARLGAEWRAKQKKREGPHVCRPPHKTQQKVGQ